MAREATWTNADGLVVGFGTHSDDNRVPAVQANRDGYRVITMTFTGTELEDIASLTAASLFPQTPRIPRGSLIHRATFQVVTAFDSAGDAGTLTIGTVAYGAIGTVDDVDGIDATVAQSAIDAIGETVICNGALVGGTVPVGATSNTDVAIVAGYATAAFTAGEGILVVEYSLPQFYGTLAA